MALGCVSVTTLFGLGTPACRGRACGPCHRYKQPLPGVPSHGPTEIDQWEVTVLCLFGVLLPDAGLTDPEVSSSSAEDQEDKSYVGDR